MIKTTFLFILSINLYAFGLNQVLNPEKDIKNNFIEINDNIDIEEIIKKYSFNEMKDFLLLNRSYIYKLYLNKNNLLHLAVKYNKYKLVKFLLKYDIDISLQNSNGNTPVHIAIYNENFAILTILSLDNNFTKTLYIKNYENMSPLDLAKKSKNIDIKNFFKTYNENSLIESKIIPLSKKIKNKYKRSVLYGNDSITIGN